MQKIIDSLETDLPTEFSAPKVSKGLPSEGGKTNTPGITPSAPPTSLPGTSNNLISSSTPIRTIQSRPLDLPNVSPIPNNLCSIVQLDGPSGRGRGRGKGKDPKFQYNF